MISAQNARQLEDGYISSQKEGVLQKISLPQAGSSRQVSAGEYIREKVIAGNGFRSLTGNKNSGFEYYEHLREGMNVPTASVTDAMGNTYITGMTTDTDKPGGNFVTIKLDTEGNLLWESEIPSQEDFAIDLGIAVVLDEVQNPIVSGIRWNGNDMDVLTIKYDGSTGDEIWSETFDNGQQGLDVPTALATTPSGDLVVAGITFYDNSVEYLLLKYDLNGQLLWSYSDVNDSEPSWNEPSSVAVNDEGEIAVTGFGAVLQVSDGYYEGYITAVFDPDGELQWKQEYFFEKIDEFNPDGDPIPTHSAAKDVEFDSSGSVYVTGTFDHSGLPAIGTIKYDNNGEEQWVDVFRAGIDNNHITNGHNIEITSADNIYIGGRHRFDWMNEGLVLLSLDTDGEPNWIKETNDIIQIQDSKLALSSAEMPVISGVGNVVDSQDNLFKVIQYDTEGNLTSESGIIRQLSNFESFMGYRGFDIDENDNAYLTFLYFYTDKGGVFETTKLPAGSGENNQEWTHIYEKPNSVSGTSFRNGVADSQNNSFVAGEYGVIEDLTYYRTFFVVKYDENGEPQWEKSFNALNGNQADGIRVMTNQNDELLVFLIPNFNDGLPLGIKKFDTDGNLMWEVEKELDYPYLSSFFIDNENNIIVAGSAQHNPDEFFNKFFIAKFSDSGEELWTEYATTGDEDDSVFEIAAGTADKDNNLVFTGTSGFATMFSEEVNVTVMKYSPSGELIWLKKYPQGDFVSAGVDILADDEGNIYTVGVRQEPVMMIEEMFAVQLDSEGELLWEMSYGQSDIGRRIKPYDVHFSSKGSLVVTNYSLYWVPGEATNNRITALNINKDDGSLLWDYNTEIGRYYGDSYLDADDKLYIFHQTEGSPLPAAIFGGFADGGLTVIDNDGFGEEIHLEAPNVALFAASSIMPLPDGRLILGGEIFNDFVFGSGGIYNGWYFYQYSHSPSVGVEDIAGEQGLTDNHQLGQNFPNPVTANTEIPFYLLQPEKVVINIYDNLGRKIAELVNGEFGAGNHTVAFERSNLPQGIYYYEFTAGEYKKTRKMVVK